jgi:protein-tyrosine phosphatase
VAQNSLEILEKFHDIEWQQQLRIANGRNDPSSKWTQDITNQAKLRNRYFNVQPWEKSRIHLKVAEGECDYINASPISLRDPNTGQERTYIAAQVQEPYTGSSYAS